MPTFAAPDGTARAYRVLGEGLGDPVVCLPGGPMRAGAYLGDLGGLAAHRPLVVLDLRGTGESAELADPATYRRDRQVADVEALREHLGADRLEPLGHSAGASLAVKYAAAHPRRVGRLALITPSARSLALDPSPGERRLAIARRSAESWFLEVSGAYEAIAGRRATSADWAAVAPLYYGRWDDAAKAHHATEAGQRNAKAAPVYNSDGAFDPVRTRAELARVTAPVLVLAGALDWITPSGVASAIAALFPGAVLEAQPGVSHYPWVDDPAVFTGNVANFLA
ncbi:alpha/beta fold hydrolase [Amycolatopsis sp. FDAARGOS 1241]|uniref:alpha/beta fold hydrolase n=1 Tax=Amycolatopsis sp. FDAARGOS 1241 TaxID=2778070 RepID=UPI001952242D|nr:alpha/beta hydrolase [Amycolatopsis sp. FDAARGOS 1241]QRP49522.1 alpha/beta hydrolase [Amycolatopsis sp. FDAARGOS 1241]